MTKDALVGVLPISDVAGGHTFFVQQLHSPTAKWPMAVHATCAQQRRAASHAHRSAAPAGPSVAILPFYGYRDARFRTAMQKCRRS